MEKCALCNLPGTSSNRINTHHVKGRNFPDTMRVHTRGCHAFADWITQEFTLRDNLSILTANIIVYFYNKATFFHGDRTFVPSS